MDKITVAVKKPGESLYVTSVEPTLENFKKLVDCEHLEGVRFDGSIFMYLDDLGKFKDKIPNFKWGINDVVVGNAVFIRAAFDGEEVSLTKTDITSIQSYLATTSYPSCLFRH